MGVVDKLMTKPKQKIVERMSSVVQQNKKAV
jgi:hypothetical protein